MSLNNSNAKAMVTFCGVNQIFVVVCFQIKFLPIFAPLYYAKLVLPQSGFIPTNFHTLMKTGTVLSGVKTSSVTSYLAHSSDPCDSAVTEVWTELLTLLGEEEVNLIVISH